MKFDVSHAASIDRYAGTKDIRLVNLGPIALFSKYKLAKSSRKNLISFARIVFLMHRLLTSARDTDILSIDFDRNRIRRERELSNNKHQQGKNQVRTMLKEFFWFSRTSRKSPFMDWDLK